MNNKPDKGTKSHSDLIMPPNEVDRVVNDLFSAFTADLGRPFTAGNRNVRSVIRTWCPLSQGDMDGSVQDFKRSYISAHFLDRYFYTSEQGVHDQLERGALDKFVANLSRGKIMNDYALRFLPYGRLNSILMSASLEVAQILGPFDEERWFDFVAHGPNATLGVSKEDAYHHNKVVALDGTLPALRTFEHYLDWNTQLGEFLIRKFASNEVSLQVVAGNRLSFVPKKFDSLRTMSVEPTINQALQQGLGKYIAERLVHAGIELETQPDCHRRLVRKITENDLDIATIDWSQASDRIWLGLAERLLPSDWFAAIQDIRSPVTTYRGVEYTLTMVGSMGNGTTFPLQTLLFLCLLRALVRESDVVHGPLGQCISVFGDDCICDSSLIPEVEWLAAQLGWTLNSDKSFSAGGFRESCGEDSYRGTNCRPFRIERPNDANTRPGLTAWLYGAYNQCSAAMQGVGSPHHIDKWLLRTFEKYKLGEIFFVPPRFSEVSGVRIKDPHVLNPIDGTSSQVRGDAYFGYTFPYLGNSRKFVECDQEPYFLLALKGDGVPKSFRKAVIQPEEDPDLNGMCPNGHVPWKGVKYRKKIGRVLTWAYFIE